MKLRIVGLLWMIAGAMLITACGQKGPLYLPKDETMDAPAASQPTDASEGAVEAADKAADQVEKKEPGDTTEKVPGDGDSGSK